MAKTCAKWLSAIDALPALHARWMRVQIEQADWRVILDRYDTPESLFYLDPPYLPEMRKQGGYALELTLSDHQDLVHILLSLQGKAVLSGYPSPVYDPLRQAGWNYQEWQTSCHAAGGRAIRSCREKERLGSFRPAPRRYGSRRKPAGKEAYSNN